MDLGGAAVPGTRGYKYYGRAKYLDGVKELFEKAGRFLVFPKSGKFLTLSINALFLLASIQEKLKPEELAYRVDADYYGYRDEEDGLLLRYETRLQKQSMYFLLHVCDA